ncbi:MAG: glycogen/starch/alpha-glucan phosphorylase, partial [Terriglobus roseus]|nr:glycogen/starch/alpha-glucan phosphorylase [Terriglobus roseus]
MRRTIGKPVEFSNTLDQYRAMAHLLRDRIMDDWITTVESYVQHNVRVVCYLSAEYLLGPHLLNGMLNLGITRSAEQACKELHYDLNELADEEPEPGLGNGGLGRLAACYMDSMTTLEVPAIGYGLRYEFGIFRQEIRDGWQVEHSDKWLEYGNPWEIPSSDATQHVSFG